MSLLHITSRGTTRTILLPRIEAEFYLNYCKKNYEWLIYATSVDEIKGEFDDEMVQKFISENKSVEVYYSGISFITKKNSTLEHLDEQIFADNFFDGDVSSLDEAQEKLDPNISLRMNLIKLLPDLYSQ